LGSRKRRVTTATSRLKSSTTVPGGYMPIQCTSSAISAESIALPLLVRNLIIATSAQPPADSRVRHRGAVTIRQRDHLGFTQHFCAGQLLRVTGSVDELVMLPDDVQAIPGRDAERRELVCTLGGVHADRLTLFRASWSVAGTAHPAGSESSGWP